jgi:hypothetical protein
LFLPKAGDIINPKLEHITLTKAFYTEVFHFIILAVVAQPGTAQAWKLPSESKDSLFPKGYPGSKNQKQCVLI